MFSRIVIRRPGLTGRPKSFSNTGNGYALLLIMFLLALVVLAAAAAAPRILTQGTREKEQEMIWRGEQYERGIKLYFKKNNRLPGSVDDLIGTGQGQRYLRRRYKDPMNQADGSWRMIYLGPAGQLIGSTRPEVVFTLGAPGGIGGPQSVSSPGASTTQGSGQSFFSQPQNGTSFGSVQTGNPSGPGNSGTLFSSASLGSRDTSGLSPSDNPMNASTSASSQDRSSSGLFGGRIIGIGSKVDGNSIRWLNGAKNYRQFEFIWDPSKEGYGVNPAKLFGQPPGDGSSNPQPVPFGQSNGLNGLRSAPPAQSSPE